MLKAPDESIKDETAVGVIPQPLCQLHCNFTRFARKVAPPTLTLMRILLILTSVSLRYFKANFNKSEYKRT